MGNIECDKITRETQLFNYSQSNKQIETEPMTTKRIAKRNPIVVMKQVVKEPSEKRRRRQLFPTPSKNNNKRGLFVYVINPDMSHTKSNTVITL